LRRGEGSGKIRRCRGRLADDIFLPVPAAHFSFAGVACFGRRNCVISAASKFLMVGGLILAVAMLSTVAVSEAQAQPSETATVAQQRGLFNAAAHAPVPDYQVNVIGTVEDERLIAVVSVENCRTLNRVDVAAIAYDVLINNPYGMTVGDILVRALGVEVGSGWIDLVTERARVEMFGTCMLAGPRRVRIGTLDVVSEGVRGTCRWVQSSPAGWRSSEVSEATLRTNHRLRWPFTFLEPALPPFQSVTKGRCALHPPRAPCS